MIIYNTAIEITESQYKRLIANCSGMLFHRIENGKYYIRVCDMRFKQIIEKQL